MVQLSDQIAKTSKLTQVHLKDQQAKDYHGKLVHINSLGIFNLLLIIM